MAHFSRFLFCSPWVPENRQLAVQPLAISKQHLSKVQVPSSLGTLKSSGAGPSPRGSPRLAVRIRDGMSRGIGFRFGTVH